MSELLVNTIKKADGTGSLSVPAESGTVVTTASPSLGRRNLIINGAMQVAQRGTSHAVTADNTYTLDRWKMRYYASGTGRVTVSQETSVLPENFTNALKVAVTTTATSGTYGYGLEYRIEGNQFSPSGFGKSTAKNLTVSFWVRSSVTGTYNFGIRSSDILWSYIAEYTVNSADTWEYKTITIDATTSGTWYVDNRAGAFLSFGLGSRTGNEGTVDTWQSGNLYYTSNQVDWISNTGATFYLTGVQLEVGSVATPFEHRSYGEELALCQRYFYLFDPSSTTIFPATRFGSYALGFTIPAPTVMRASPSYSNDGGTVQFYYRGNGTNGPFDNPAMSTFAGNLFTLQASGITHNPDGNYAYTVYATVNGEHYFDAEL